MLITANSLNSKISAYNIGEHSTNAASKLGKKSNEKNRPTMTVYTTHVNSYKVVCLLWNGRIFGNRFEKKRRSEEKKKINEINENKRKKRNRRKQRKKKYKITLIDSRNTDLAMFQRRRFESRGNPVREDNNIAVYRCQNVISFLLLLIFPFHSFLRTFITRINLLPS